MPVDAAAEEKFGPYLVYERLGVGGMATVHRALEQNPAGYERMVALKRLLPHLAEDASFIKSFVREAKLASILNHVNIVQIYELGRVGTEYFISMEYIDGRDLRQLLRHARKVTGPPPMHITVALMIQLCEALDYAHTKVDEDGTPLGLVHRDISPSNLIVTGGGHLKVIDFGIAKAESSALRTQTGRVKGKLAYMAPEALNGSNELDARSDIWATGVILHELCTARPLFASKNDVQTLLKVQQGDFHPPSTFNQACPPEIDAVVLRALARDPDQRYSSAAELREDLLAIKKQYSLQTGYRDVAAWISWAFSVEAPGGFSGDTGGNSTSVSRTGSAPKPARKKAPRPPRDAEVDEAIDAVWGGGPEEDSGGPVVLDDVPDVSDPNRVDIDDRPTPLPRNSAQLIYGVTAQLDIAPATDPGLPPRTIDPALARGTDPPIARGSDQMRAQVHTRQSGQQPAVPMPGQSRVRTTSQGMPAVKRPTSPPSGQPPAPQRPSDRQPVVDAPRISDRLEAQRARDSVPPETHGRTAAAAGTPEVDAIATNPFATGLGEPDAGSTQPIEMGLPELDPASTAVSSSLSAEELFGTDAEAALDAMSDSIATMTAMLTSRDDTTAGPDAGPSPHRDATPPASTREQRPAGNVVPSVPVVRFSKSQSIPPLTKPAESSQQRTLPPQQQHKSLPPQATASPVPAQTKPGIAPVPATKAPHPIERARSSPAAVESPRAATPRRVGLYIALGLALAGGTAAAVAFLIGQGPDASTAPTANVAASAAPLTRTTGTVKFVTEPSDAQIRIEGKAVHAGSPYSTELAAGIHQVEIFRTGYKAWLTSVELSANESQTLRVVLEPITSSDDTDATLTVATTPPGLDVYIDGEQFPGKTPIKTKLKVGTHRIIIRQNGVEVWSQNVNAEASSDYEFNPSFTDDKKRERAERAAPRPRTAPRAPAAPAPSPAPQAAPAAPPPPPQEPPAPAQPAPTGPLPPATSLSP